jgi:hypothetical protein
MYAFMDVRAAMKQEERCRAEEEVKKIRAFNPAIDERLGRAIEDQKRREAQRAKISRCISLEIKKEG